MATRAVRPGVYLAIDLPVDIATAVRPTDARDLAAMKLDRLKDALDRGYQDVAAGRVIELETEDQIDALFASL